VGKICRKAAVPVTRAVEEMSVITVAIKKRDKKYVLKPHEEYQADSNPTDVLGAVKRKREEE